MTGQCWNCSTQQGKSAEYCSECGQPLRPNAQQRQTAQESIRYTMAEIRRWTSVPDWWKTEARQSYQSRLERLRNWQAWNPSPRPEILLKSLGPTALSLTPALGGVLWQASQPAPRSRPAPAPVRPASLPSISAEAWDSPLHRPDPADSQPTEADQALRMVLEALSEKKIRLLYALGGILLVSAGVGTLRSSWDGWGRQVMALLLTLMPGLFYWLASQLREKLPVSGRMFTVLGSGMLPLGILTLNTFNVGGLQAPSWLWNPLAFTIGFAVNRYWSRQTGETICTYLAGLCLALAGWTTGSGLVLGLTCFGAAASLLWRHPEETHWHRVAHGLSGLGLLAAFLQGRLEAGTAATLFLLAIVYFTSRALATASGTGMLLASLVSVACSSYLSYLLDWPQATVALAALGQGILFLRQGENGQKLAIPFTGLILALFLGIPGVMRLFDHFQGIAPAQLATASLTGFLAALYYGWSAYRFQRPVWLYGSTLSCLYGYFMLLALTGRTEPSLYRGGLLLLAVVWMVGVTWLRRRVSEDYLRPWVWTAASLSLLIIPLNAALQMASADHWTPWVYLGCALVTALSAAFERKPAGLYFSAAAAALAYASWLPIWFGQSQESNVGLAFAPFLSVLALASLAMRRQSQLADYAPPLLNCAALASVVCAAVQIPYLSQGYWNTVPPALIFYAVAFALPRQRWTNLSSGLCAWTALACWDHLGPQGLSLGLVGAGLTALSLRPGWHEAGLLWSAVAVTLTPSPIVILPSLIWLGVAARKEQPGLTLVSSLLILPALPHCWNSSLNGLLLVHSLGLLGLAYRRNQQQELGQAWLQLKACYLCGLGLEHPWAWTGLLWLEFVGLIWLQKRQLSVPVWENMTLMSLLVVSPYLGGGVNLLNPWLVTLALLGRGRAGSAPLSHLTAFWASMCTAHEMNNPTLLPLLVFAFSYVDAYTARRELLQVTSLVGWLCCLASNNHGLPLLLLGAGPWLWDARRQRSSLWGAVLLLYHAYVHMLWGASVTTAELYLVPLGIWFLVWGSYLSQDSNFRRLGLFTLLAPSLLLSLGSGTHALWAGSLALGLLAWGQLAGWGSLQAWAGLALLLEVAIQAVLFAANLPWHQWAVAGGLLLVGMAALVERQRQAVLEASRSFMEKLRQW